MEPDLYHDFENALTQQTQQWVKTYEAPEADTAHQFVLFLKPEVTAVHEGVNVQAALKLILERLTAFEVSVHAIRVLPASYLDKHSILDQHYGVINAISKQGASALADAAREKLHTVFADEIEQGALILGGHQFLSEQSDFSALALSTLNDNIGTTKLGGGSYCMKLNVLGQTYLLLNPFHAYQLVPFTTPGRAIIVLEGRSNKDWEVLRSELTGATNPAKAHEGSIRAELLARKEELNLKAVNQGNNGVHLSAGPLEGMVELKRFFSDHEVGKTLDWTDLRFGQQLADAGVSRERITELAANIPLNVEGQPVPAFDLTEEVNAAEALKSLI
jgi:hypothetical protein